MAGSSKLDRREFTLQAALATYRALARNSSVPPLPAVVRGIRPGDKFTGATALHARLTAFGDIVPGTAPPAGPTMQGRPIERV